VVLALTVHLSLSLDANTQDLQSDSSDLCGIAPLAASFSVSNFRIGASSTSGPSRCGNERKLANAH
jgi:hypothetical protein